MQLSTSAIRRVRRGALVIPALALALAGCQTGQPVNAPSMAIGQTAEQAEGVPLPTIKAGGAGKNDGYFLMALPKEADLSKQIVKVAGGGAAGSLAQTLASSAAPAIVNVIPNDTGFIIEGTKLNTAGLKFYIGADEMVIAKQLPHVVVLTFPKTFRQTSGILTVRQGAVNLLRASVDAKNVNVTGRVMVEFPEGTPRLKIEQAMLAAGITYYRYPGMNYVVAYHAPDQTFDAVKAKLLAQTGVFTQVTRDTIFEGKALNITDPRYPEQWALQKINAASGWNYTAGSPDVVVAVLDTGVNLTHPDLVGNIFKNNLEIAGNGKDDDGNGRIDDINGWNSYDQTGNVEDDNGHGTEMAGIIAARQNTVGGVGLAYNTRILPCKVSNAEGVATSSTVIDGINYAIRNRASVINMSLASNIDDPAVKDAIEFATTFNATVVCAMGNDGNYIKQYPAAWSKDLPILAVGATNSVDARPSWGTYGEWMSVCAPGEAILTTTKGGGYGVASGTSHAAAHVSALSALIKGLKPGWTPAMVRELIQKTAIDRGAPGFDNYYGWGRITLDTSALGGLLEQVFGEIDLEASTLHELGLTPASAAMDKDSETYWSSARRGQDDPQWLSLDLGKPMRIKSFAGLSSPYYAELFPADFQIQVSNDEKTWTTVASENDFKVAESTWTRWSFPEQNIRYIRMYITRSRQNQDNDLYYAQVAEVALNGEENALVRNSSTSYYGFNYPSKNMTDKKPDTFWVSAPTNTYKYQYAIADLGLSQGFKTIRLLSPPQIISEAFPKSVAFYASNDKVNWSFIKEFKGLQATPSTWYNFDVPASSARYLRIDATETNRAQGHGTLYGGYHFEGYAAAVAEVEVK